MATYGRLGAVKPAANTDTALYTSPAATLGTVTISCCNQGAEATIRVAVCSGGVGTLAATDYIEFDSPISGVTERTAIVVYNGQSVVVSSSSGEVSFVAYGLEE